MERTPIEKVTARAFRFPTETPQEDGTLAWDSTTMVVVWLHAGAEIGMGYTYGHEAIREMVAGDLATAINQLDAMDVPAAWEAMVAALRNNGRPGLSAMAVSAVDVALWDLKGKLVGLPLMDLLGRAHKQVPVYGSGGFTNYSDAELEKQLEGWCAEGIRAVKIKVGRNDRRDLQRAELARRVIGAQRALMADANGAYTPPRGLRMIQDLQRSSGVCYMEEPLSSDALEQLALLRQQRPGGMEIAAGEYGYTPDYFRRMVQAGAVDVLQADVTRCGGITGIQKASAVSQVFFTPLSAHCAPAISTVACAALSPTIHMEYFHDHVRLEKAAFDGFPALEDGALIPPAEAPGHGFAFKDADMARYEVS